MKPIKRIAVIGHTGIFGAKVVQILRKGGHDVVAASPTNGVNTVTGEGLTKALNGVQVVIDVTHLPSWDNIAQLEHFESSSTNIAEAEKEAGVSHHVALSVVGTDRMLGCGYFRGKIVQEMVVQSSSIPYTIIRSTQFFEFVESIAFAATKQGTIRVSPTMMQPIASEDVASTLVEVALGNPMNGIMEIAGPEEIFQDELLGLYLAATADPRVLVSDPDALYFGVRINDDRLTPGKNPRLGSMFFIHWLKQVWKQNSLPPVEPTPPPRQEFART